MALADDLDVVEKSIRQLQIEWEKFFSGVEKKPPTDLRARVEAVIRRHANAEIRNNTERFRYQNLTAKYNTFNELWSKKLRAREEGKAFGVHGLKADVLPPPPPPAAATAAHHGVPGTPRDEFRVQDPQRDARTVRSLYERFLEARKTNGETAPVKYESFQKLIGQQASRILTDKGGAAVEFRLETKDGKVSLKAKVVK
jgi:hypothetical protein